MINRAVREKNSLIVGGFMGEITTGRKDKKKGVKIKNELDIKEKASFGGKMLLRKSGLIIRNYFLENGLKGQAG